MYKGHFNTKYSETFQFSTHELINREIILQAREKTLQLQLRLVSFNHQHMLDF